MLVIELLKTMAIVQVRINFMLVRLQMDLGRNLEVLIIIEVRIRCLIGRRGQWLGLRQLLLEVEPIA